MNETNEPMQEAVLMSRALYEQAREALRMIQDWLAGDRYADQDLPEIMDKIRETLAAMEDAHA